MESKKDIYDLIPDAYYPATLFFKAGTGIEKIMAAIQENQMSFPADRQTGYWYAGKMRLKNWRIKMNCWIMH